MSISRLAIRAVTKKALSGRTLAGARVYDSSVDPIDLQARENRQPFITVYTDDHSRSITGRDLMMGEEECQLILEVAVAAQVSVPVPAEHGGGVEEAIVIPATDAGLEQTLDLIGYQAFKELMTGTTVWAGLWREFAFRVKKIDTRRGASSDSGVRIAARQIAVSLEMISDPTPGEALSGTWESVLAAFEDDDELDGIAAVIRYAVVGEGDMTPEAIEAGRFGLNPETIDQLGIAPVRDEAGDAVPLDGIDVDADGETWQLDPEDEA